MITDEFREQQKEGTKGQDGRQQIKVALAGQPNVGKSTVFNMLTGLSQHVGNWPGKTIEKKAGVYCCDDTSVHIVDLPGTYSLTANSVEERITRDYIIRERPDVVVAIANAASLEHGLYLLAELLCLPAPVVLGLNMMDIAKRQGLRVEPHVLEAALGLPVVPMVASKNQGLRTLMATVERLVRASDTFAPDCPAINTDNEKARQQLQKLIAGHVPAPYPDQWVTLKLLEGDEELTAMVRTWVSPEAWQEVQEILCAHENAVLSIAGARYEWVGRMLRAALQRPTTGQLTVTDRLDRLVTHPFLGLIFLLAILTLAFSLTYTVAMPLQRWLDLQLVQGAAEWVRQMLQGVPGWLVSLLADGIIGGAGTVLTFLPILLIFFALLGLLEDVGYLARAAYVMDPFMHPMGLHGRSCMALCLGFGCNVPAVLGARVVDSERGRLLTILLVPLIPCAGRLAVLAFLAPIFFPGQATLVSVGLVAVNLLALAVVGLLVNRVFFRGPRTAFIMELPLYHAPNLRTVALYVWHNTAAFIRNAGTLIVLFSVVLWAMAAFPGPGIGHSLLATVGRWLAPAGRLMGLDWRMMVALLSSFLAKENTIATLGVLYRVGQEGAPLSEVLGSAVGPAAALAFLTVQMLFIPCVATMAVIRQETGGWRWVALSAGLLLVISLVAGIVIYQGGMLLAI
jgi:ferrous iron transport protein B